LGADLYVDDRAISVPVSGLKAVTAGFHDCTKMSNDLFRRFDCLDIWYTQK
jgi:hypothetical protein